MAQTHTEREDKYDVDPAYRLPDLGTVVEVDAPEVVHLESTYFDTAERALLGQRLTLRRRTGDTDTGWHLKVPHGTARLEVQLPLESGVDVPEQLAGLVAGVTLGRPLAPIAVLRTERTIVRLRRGDTVLAELADDRVRAEVLGDQLTISEWREVEVELVDGDEALMRAAGKALRKAGARPAAAASKIGRALGQAPAPDPDPASASDLVGAYLREQLATLTAGDVSLRRGLDPVHKTRVAARRVRSILRVFAPVLGADAAALDNELSWYQDLLGEVRDRQVQRARFAGLLGDLAPELVLGPVAAELSSTLLSEQARALVDVRTALDDERYRQLMLTLHVWAADPPVIAGTSVRALTRRGKQAQRKAAKRLARALRTGRAEHLHRARKAIKRSRYATELLAPALGKPADKSIKRHKHAQEVLGEHQDSVLAAGYLRRLGAALGDRGGANGFTFGLLYADERRRQDDLVAAAGKLRLSN